MTLPEFEADRLYLRPRTVSHLDANLDMDSDPDVMAFLGGVPDREEQRQKLMGQMNADVRPGLGFWSVFPKDSNEFAGWVALWPLKDHEEDCVEIGYRFIKAAWGKGFAAEAAAPVLRHAFDTVALEEVLAVTDPDHQRSQRVLAKLGLERRGTIHAYEFQLPLFRISETDPDNDIYHVCAETAWNAAKARGFYDGSADDSRDGFIHFSTRRQARTSTAKHRAGEDGLVLLAVDATALGDDLRWERSRGSRLFPHLYGELPTAAVRSATAIPLSAEGTHEFPAGFPRGE